MLKNSARQAIDVRFLIEHHLARWNEINRTTEPGLPLRKAVYAECNPYRHTIEYKETERKYRDYLRGVR